MLPAVQGIGYVPFDFFYDPVNMIISLAMDLAVNKLYDSENIFPFTFNTDSLSLVTLLM